MFSRLKFPWRCVCCLLLWLLPALAPVIAQPTEGATGGGAAAVAGEGFDILEFEVEGNSVLPAASIENAVYRFLGERKAVADVEAARGALEKTYQDAGFLSVFVDIPEQKVEQGVVVLRVTEGRVARLKVAGARYFAQGYLKEKVPALAEGEVPYFPEVQAQVAQLGTDDRRVTPVLRAGRAPATVEAELKVEDRLPLSASLELNNRYSLNTSRPRLVGSLRYANLWQRDHSASLTFQSSPVEPSEVKVLSGNYVFPVAGAVLALYAVNSNSNVASGPGSSFIGKGGIYGARLIRSLPSRGDYSHSLTLGVDAKDFKDRVLFGGDTTLTPIRYVPFSIAYGARLAAAASTTSFNVAANFHFRGFGDHDVDCAGQRVNAFACKRFGADANYLYLRADASRLQALPAGWSLFARISGQAASQPLISNEQFGAGGADTVRGYVEFERVGDRGLATSLELRAPNLANAAAPGLRELGLIGFWEGAALSYISPLPGTPDRFGIASVGFGLRIKGWQTFNAALDIAWPLKDGAPRAGVADYARVPRVHVRVAYDF